MHHRILWPAALIGPEMIFPVGTQQTNQLSGHAVRLTQPAAGGAGQPRDPGDEHFERVFLPQTAALLEPCCHSNKI